MITNQNQKPASLADAIGMISDLRKLLAARDSTIATLQAAKTEYAITSGRLQAQFDVAAKELATAKAFDMRHVGGQPIHFRTELDMAVGLSDQDKWKKVSETEKTSGKSAADRLKLQLGLVSK